MSRYIYWQFNIKPSDGLIVQNRLFVMDNRSLECTFCSVSDFLPIHFGRVNFPDENLRFWGHDTSLLPAYSIPDSAVNDVIRKDVGALLRLSHIRALASPCLRISNSR